MQTTTHARQTPRRHRDTSFRWNLLALLTSLLLGGCSATLTGTWVVPRFGGIENPAVVGERPTVYVSSTARFSPSAEVSPEACTEGLESPECAAWRERTERSLSEATASILSRKSDDFRFESVHLNDESWRARASAGDLHVHVSFEDVLKREVGYGVMVYWRSDTYDASSFVQVSTATDGRELANFTVTERAELGLNYLWFIDIFIPFFPLYMDDNDEGRSQLLARNMVQISERLAPTLGRAHEAAKAAPSSSRPRVAQGKASALSGGAINLQRWLDLPKVRLVAVDFYADWCEPCRASIPRWQALHQKWRERGLRVVVVHTQSREGHATPGWSPDDVIADPYGTVAKTWKVDDRLPQAFLFSWDGQPLVSGASVEELERAVEDWFANAPRITVAAPETGAGKALADAEAQRLAGAVRGELTRQGKLEVVADPRERALLARLRKESHRADRDDATRCQLGREVSPNMLLKVVVEAARGERPRALRLELFGIEKACMLGWTSVPLGEGQEDAAAAEAVAKLLSSLQSAPRMSAD